MFPHVTRLLGGVEAWATEVQPSGSTTSHASPAPGNGTTEGHAAVPWRSPTTRVGKISDKVRQFLGYVFLWFPHSEEHTFFTFQTKQRIRITQVMAAVITSWFLVRALICALQGAAPVTVLRVSSGVRSGDLDARMVDASPSTVAVQYSLCSAFMLVGVWHCVMPFVPRALKFWTCRPWLHYGTMWVYMGLLGAIAIWEMRVRQDPLFDILCGVVAFSIMRGVFLFRHWCAYAMLITIVIPWMDVQIEWHEVYRSPITVCLMLNIWHHEHQERQLFRAHKALAREAAARAEGEKVAKSAQKVALAAKKAADIARATESRFLARMSHEIRTPLSGMLGFLDLLAKTRLSEEQQDLFEPMLTAAGLLKVVVNDILDLSKSKAGMLQFTLQSRSLYHTIRSSFAVFSALLASKDLASDVQIADSLPEFVTLDHVRLQQMVANLLSNSIKFTQRGSVGCRVDPVSLGAGQEGIKVQVLDTGMGISAEAIPRLFQDFTQADKSVAQTHGGTGLGLSMVKRLATAMGGSAGVTSVLGDGSCFWFTLALSPEDGGSVAGSSPDTATFPAGFSVMVVDDTPMLLKVMKHQLAHRRCPGVFLKSGQEAVDHLQVWGQG